MSELEFSVKPTKEGKATIQPKTSIEIDINNIGVFIESFTAAYELVTKDHEQDKQDSQT